MSILIGVDVGTSGLKAIAIDAETGAVLASAMEEYPLSTPRTGWAEQDAEDFSTAALTALTLVARALGRRAGEVKGIGLSGQMHSAVLLDAGGAVLRPAILWCDTRTTSQCEKITETAGLTGLRELVGNRALEGFTLPKLLWVREHERAIYDRIAHVLMPKDYVGRALTGELGTDDSDASGTLAFDPGRATWSRELLAKLDIDAGIFPPSGPSASALGALSIEVASLTGLPPGIPVARGAADNAAGAVGLGVVRPGDAMASLGTSGVVLAQTATYVVEPEMRLHSFCHAVPNKHYVMGVMLSAGGALRWYRDQLCDAEKLAAEMRGVDVYELITEAASTSRVGAGGVVFLPYLMGERTPHADASARAALIGMTARTSKSDISRAVLEGISFGLRDALDLIRDAVSVRELRLTGGGAKSAFWRQLLADVLDVTIATTTSTEGPAFGAAILGGVAAGVHASVEEACDALVHVARRVRPDPITAAKYRDVHTVYQALYGDLKGRFAALRAIE